jgi:hypothetical protein
VGDLETLETVNSLGLSSDNIEDRINELGTFSVMTLGPIVTSTALTKNATCQLTESNRGKKLTSYQVGRGFLEVHLG